MNAFHSRQDLDRSINNKFLHPSSHQLASNVEGSFAPRTSGSTCKLLSPPAAEDKQSTRQHRFQSESRSVKADRRFGPGAAPHISLQKVLAVQGEPSRNLSRAGRSGPVSHIPGLLPSYSVLRFAFLPSHLAQLGICFPFSLWSEQTGGCHQRRLRCGGR